MIVTVHYQLYTPNSGKLITLSYEEITCTSDEELVTLSNTRVQQLVDKYKCKVISNFVKYSYKDEAVVEENKQIDTTDSKNIKPEYIKKQPTKRLSRKKDDKKTI